MKQKYNYVPANFIMLRSNTLPYNCPINKIKVSGLFRDALSIASSNLSKSFNSHSDKLTSKEKRHLKLGILKYSKRITNRPTPFGMFSSISFGNVCNTNNLNKIRNYKKIKGVTPDFKWFLQILKKYESNISNKGRNVKLIINNLVYHVGNVYILDEKSLYGRSDFHKIENRFILNESPLLNSVLELLVKPVSFKDLLNIVYNKFNDYTKKQISIYIQKLIDNEFIVSDLRPTIYDNNILKRFIAKIHFYKIQSKLTQKLIYINKLIEKYSHTTIGEDYDVYINLVNNMKQISDVKNPLRIDVRADYDIIPKVNYEVANRSVHAVENLLRIGPKKSNYPWLNKYLNEFIERYGLEQVINVNKVLDKTFGIGYPDGYLDRKNSMNKDEMPISTSIKLDSLWIKNLLKGKKTIELSDTDFNDMDNTKKLGKKLPNSGEVYFKLLKNKNKNKKDKIILSNMIGSLSAGNTFGRFWYLLNDKERKCITKFQDNTPLNDDYLKVEISEIPSFGENGNVMNNKSNLSKHMKLRVVNSPSDNDEIDPDDVYVGATLKSLYFYSKKYKKKLYFTANNMLNFQYCSRLYRFLFEVSLMTTQTFTPISLSDEYIYMPRIEWNDVILRLSAWNLRSDKLLTKNKLNKNLFNLFCNDYFVPRYVLLTSGDNTLNLDLKNDEDIDILEQELRRTSSVLLTEDFFENNKDSYDLPLKINNNFYKSEFVLPFNRLIKKTVSGNNISQLVSNDELDYYSQFFNEDWFYVDINVDFSRRKEILKVLTLFVNELKEKDSNILWFYINYKNNNGNTIRYRIKHNNTSISLESIINQFRKIFFMLYNHGLVSDYSIRRYVPETYRYGGKNLLPLVEKFFEIDSEISSYVLNKYNKSDLLYINSIDDYYIMKYLGLSLNQILKNTNSLVNKSFKKQNHILSKKIIKFDKNIKLFFNKDLHLYQMFNKEFSILMEIRKKITSESLTYERKLRIINSLMHMHSNRINGIDIAKEGQSLYLSNVLVRYKIYHE